MTLNDVEQLVVKTALYTLSTYLQGPNFDQFRSKTSRFRQIRHFIIPY